MYVINGVFLSHRPTPGHSSSILMILMGVSAINHTAIGGNGHGHGDSHKPYINHISTI